MILKKELLREVDTIVILTVSMKTLGTKIGQWLGISVLRLNVVPEYFEGPMEATTTITYEKQMIYLITTQSFIILTLIMFAEVKLPTFNI